MPKFKINPINSLVGWVIVVKEIIDREQIYTPLHRTWVAIWPEYETIESISLHSVFSNHKRFEPSREKTNILASA